MHGLDPPPFRLAGPLELTLIVPISDQLSAHPTPPCSLIWDIDSLSQGVAEIQGLPNWWVPRLRPVEVGLIFGLYSKECSQAP